MFSTLLQLRAEGKVDPDAGYDGFIGWVIGLMESMGETGVGIAIFIENFFPPIPSEAVLPGAGFLAYEGRMNFALAWAAATLGAVVGAWVWYAVGAAIGRDRTRAVIGAIPLMKHEDFDKSEEFFQRYGVMAVLFGRCVPLVRSFISLPAGVERMPFGVFTIYTTIGSAVWNGVWIGLGFGFGPAIKPALERWSGVLSYLVVAVILGLVLWFVVVRLRERAREAGAS